MSKVALITGSTRGIGKTIAETLAKEGYNIVVAGKSIKNNNKLPGTIYSVKDELQNKYNIDVLACKLNLTDDTSIIKTVQKTIDKFGKIDILINNAGALYWDNIENTPINKYDLINNVNGRGSFYLSKLCLEHMKKRNYGHIIMHSPPLSEWNNKDIYTYKTGYLISKYAMTMTALGISAEYKDYNIAANTIWPKKAIESYATKNNNLGNKTQWRKPNIIADVILEIINENPKTFSGNQLIDEEYLTKKGVNDFSKYRCVETNEPVDLDISFEKYLKIIKAK